MMLELGVVELGNVQPFIKQFRLLDADGNARLGRDDLDATKDKSLAELQRDSVRRMKRQMSMRVGDRMGLAFTVAGGSSEGGQGTSGAALSLRGLATAAAPLPLASPATV
jgi:hypothetical protein